jgi:hypothetical protein
VPDEDERLMQSQLSKKPRLTVYAINTSIPSNTRHATTNVIAFSPSIYH